MPLSTSKLSALRRNHVLRVPARTSRRAHRTVPLPKDFLSIRDLTPDSLEECLLLAERVKRERRLGAHAPTSHALGGAHVALLFEKPSLRTRSTFEIAIRELGGHVIDPEADSAFGSRETPADVARNLERWVRGAVIRTFAQDRLEAFAAAAPRLHVVNALTDEEHPCQALADLLTLRERWGQLKGETLTFVGDGNNVVASLAHAGAMAGMHVRISSPEGFDLPDQFVEQAQQLAQHGATVTRFRDPREAVEGARAVYTDVWTSMGQEAEAAARRAAFASFQVNEDLMSRADPDAIFMHCLPAHRGEEVTNQVIDGTQSVVFDQAENRLHTQKALLLMLLGD